MTFINGGYRHHTGNTGADLQMGKQGKEIMRNGQEFFRIKGTGDFTDKQGDTIALKNGTNLMGGWQSTGPNIN